MTSLLDHQDKWATLVDRARGVGYTDLSSDEQVWFNVQCLIQAIQDGRLISFYYNSGADHLLDCQKALEQLGASKMVSLLEAVNNLFRDGVPDTIDARNDVINSWPDDGSVDQILDPIEAEAQEEAAAVEEILLSFIQERRLDT